MAIITLPRRQRSQQRLARPVEYVRDVDLPVAAERLPRVVLDRPRQRDGPGVEHQDGRTPGVDELPGRAAIAGDPDDRAPARCKAVAMPRPKPRLAPVTSAVVSASSCSDIVTLPCSRGFRAARTAPYRHRSARHPESPWVTDRQAAAGTAAGRTPRPLDPARRPLAGLRGV